MKREPKYLKEYLDKGFIIHKEGTAQSFATLFKYLAKNNKPFYCIRTHKGLHNVNLEVRPSLTGSHVLNIQILKEAILSEIDMNHILFIQLSEVVEDGKLRIWLPKPNEINYTKPYTAMHVEFNNRTNAVAFVNVLKQIETTFIYKVKFND